MRQKQQHLYNLVQNHCDCETTRHLMPDALALQAFPSSRWMRKKVPCRSTLLQNLRDMAAIPKPGAMANECPTSRPSRLSHLATGYTKNSRAPIARQGSPTRQHALKQQDLSLLLQNPSQYDCDSKTNCHARRIPLTYLTAKSTQRKTMICVPPNKRM